VSPPRRAALLLALLLLVAPSLAACSGGSGGGGGSTQAAPQLLAKAKKTLDSTKSLHFALSSTGAPSTGTVLTGGQGDIARPSSFQGTLQVLVSGNSVGLKVISVDKKVYAQLPFTAGYSVIDPAAFGFGDPGALLDPTTGISQLLTAATNAKLGAEKRVSGDVVREVTADLPGDLVQKLLTSKDPSKQVKARMSIASGNDQLRQVELTGPFFTADQDGTYTQQLSKFGADVSITAPAAG
jgi:hypothetical protein